MKAKSAGSKLGIASELKRRSKVTNLGRSKIMKRSNRHEVSRKVLPGAERPISGSNPSSPKTRRAWKKWRGACPLRYLDNRTD